MRADDLIEVLRELSNKHSNPYVIMDSEYEGEVSIEKIEIVPYHETKYIVLKS